MATAQLPIPSPTANECDNCVQSKFREDHYFRLHVARVEGSETTSSEFPTSSRAPLPKERFNGNGSQGNHIRSAELAPKTFDSHRIMNGLSQLPLAGHSLAELERETIQQTLKLNGGNRKLSAGILGISVRTLQRKLKEYGNNTAI